MSKVEKEAEKGTETSSTEATEDPRNVARAMLIEGLSDDEIVKETGLTKRNVWGLKGGMARAGLIPTRKEKLAKEIVEKQEEERKEKERLPFRRPKTAPELIVEICNRYGVKERATRIIADRCQNVPGGILHPSDFERLLMDLDSGVKRREAMLIAEEYDLALERFSREEEEGRRGYYPRDRTSRGRRARYEEERREGFRPRYEGPAYDSYGRRLPSEYRGEVTRRDLEDMRRDFGDMIERVREKDRLDSLAERFTSQIEKLDESFGTVLENLRDEIRSKGGGEESPHIKALEVHLEAARGDAKTVREETTKQVDKMIETLRQERKEHKEETSRLEQRLSEAERRGSSIDGYNSDEMRLVADVGGKIVDAIRQRKQPIQIAITGAKELAGALEEAPVREKVGDQKITEKIPEEYLR